MREEDSIAVFHKRDELNEGEKQTAIANRLRQVVEKRLHGFRVTNDKRMTQEDTEHLRGRIAEVKAIINWLAPLKPFQER